MFSRWLGHKNLLLSEALLPEHSALSSTGRVIDGMWATKKPPASPAEGFPRILESGKLLNADFHGRVVDFDDLGRHRGAGQLKYKAGALFMVPHADARNPEILGHTRELDAPVALKIHDIAVGLLEEERLGLDRGRAAHAENHTLAQFKPGRCDRGLPRRQLEHLCYNEKNAIEWGQ